MYIWVGCKLPEGFAEKIRKVCIPLAERYVLDTSGFSLPQHISLKISFDAGERTEEVLAFLVECLSQQKCFYVNPKAPERKGTILWLPFEKAPSLTQLHNLLDREMKNRFGIEPHPFDRDFCYHSTLFMGREADLVRAEQHLHDLDVPGALKISSLLLGVSDSGKSGTYRVIREIPL